MELAGNLSSLQIEESKMEEEPSNLDHSPEKMSTDEPGQESTNVPLRRSRRMRFKYVLRAKHSPHPNKLETLRAKPENLTEDLDIHLFYSNVNKNWKTTHTNLETIFEEPKESRDGREMTMSKAKLRRSLIFNTNRITKAKKEKRRKAIVNKNKSDVIKAKIAKSAV